VCQTERSQSDNFIVGLTQSLKALPKVALGKEINDNLFQPMICFDQVLDKLQNQVLRK
jgi:hypothetical protein